MKPNENSGIAKVGHQAGANSWLSFAIFVIMAALFLLPFMRIVLSQSDEGSLLCGATRIVQGQVFARDFFEVMGPGTFYILAVLFKLFGATFVVARTYLLLSLIAAGIAILYLSRRLCTQYQWLPCIVLSGTYFGGIGQSISYHLDSNLCALLAIICMILWQSSARKALLATTGLLTGMATCILQPKGILLLCAFTVWLWLQRKRYKKPLISFCWLAGGYLSVIGITLVYFWRQGALGSLVYANYFFPTHDYGALNAVPYGLFLFKDGFWSFWVSLFHGTIVAKSIAAVLITPCILIAALPFLLVMFGLRFNWRSAAPETLLLWLCGSAVWLSEIHRRDLCHLVWGAPLLVVLFVLLLGENRSRFTDIVAMVLYISGGCLALCNLLVVGLGAKTVSTPVGTVAVFQSDFEDTLKFLSQSVSRNQEILAYPYAPEYYFLSETNNPTPYSLLVYNYNTPYQFKDTIHVLDERHVRYVVWDTNFLSKSERQSFPEAPRVDPKSLIMEPYIESHYRDIFQEGGIRVMERLDNGN